MSVNRLGSAVQGNLEAMALRLPKMRSARRKWYLRGGGGSDI